MSYFPNKQLGQNFLHDINICKKIIHFAKWNKNNIIEIGGGQGALTQFLCKMTNDFVVIEKDRRFYNILKAFTPNIFIDDALMFDFNSFVNSNSIIIGNLPYNIGTILLIKLIKKTSPLSMTFLLQREIVEKICAAPSTKHYSKLSVLVQAIASVQKGFEVYPNVFFPKPKVMSQTIYIYNINPDKSIIVNLEKILNKFFANKRKKINKVLNYFNLNIKYKHLCDLRAENITVDQYIGFAKDITLINTS